MRILGLDIGSKRIGVAISDGLGITAQGLVTLEKKTTEQVAEDIKRIIAGQQVVEVVVGLPLNMDGSYGPQAREAVAMAERLKTELKLPVTLWDERMSTMEVERLMIAHGASRLRRKRKIDKLAAQVILQSYLDTKAAK